MSETVRTLTYAACAAVALGLGWFLGLPSAAPVEAQADTGPFFPDWKDPLAATSMEIWEYDEDTGTPHQFKVMQVDDKWSIPSHANYPADAQRQLAEAATSVMDLQKLGLVTTEAADHELYGVVDPDPKNLKGGETGVGKRVTLEDGKGKKLADFIIGKEVKGQAGVRYVRVPGEDAVYRVEVKPDKLSTKFADWIEKDLLKLSSFDIKQVVLNNYSIDEVNRRVSKADVLELTYDNDKSKWTMADLAEGEELDNEKLNALKTALDDLKIVDVRRKPDGLSQELKAEEGIKLDMEAFASLQSKGFFIVQGNLLSNEGEVITRMKDGVVYVLRFGEIAADTGGVSDKEEKDDTASGDASADSTDDEGESSGSNRYIFVTAQFDPALIPQPELKPLPGESPAEAPASGEKPDDEKAADEDKPADAKADDEKAAEEDEPADAKADEAADKADDSEADDSEDSAEEAKEKKKELEKQRKEIEKENKRKQDEYDDKVKKGQERVKELNTRFADWYYVISDDVYRKIHLSRSEIIKGSAKAAGEDTSVEALKKIKEEGLQAP